VNSFFESPNPETSHNLVILHQNIAGLLNKQDILDIAIKELEETLKSIDIICLSETFISKGDEKNVRLHNHVLGSHWSRPNLKRGGVCILVKNDLNFVNLEIMKEFSMQNVFECCGISLTDSNLVVVCIYTTPNPDKSLFLHKLESLLYRLTKKLNKKIVLAGDLNIDILKNGKYAEQLVNICTSYNTKLHISQPTRKLSCIDQFISNIKSATGTVHKLGLSDHDTGQILKIKIKIQRAPKFWFQEKRDFNKSNVNKFVECIESLSFSEVLQETDSETAFNQFHDMISLLFNLNFPIILVKMSNKNKCKMQWLTKNIKRSCIVKRRLYFQYQYATNNKVHYKTLFKKYSKTLRKCIHESKRKSNINYIEKAENKGRATWKIIRYQSMNINPTSMTKKLKINNSVVEDPHDMANTFNNYFVDITNNQQGTVDIKNQISSISSSIFLKPTHEQELLGIIKGLKNTGAVGYDGLPTKIVKLCAPLFAKILVYLINLSFSEGCFPERLKCSIVKPMHKKGDVTEVSNYRPITLIPIISKIYEKVLCARLNEFFEQQNVIKREQNGFRKNMSTSLAVFKLIKTVTNCVDTGEMVVVLFFDMTKAFDFVHHDRLINKLNKYGIRGIAEKWINSYLRDRVQYTEITQLQADKHLKCFKSQLKFNRYGVPQGSVLGPLLFLTYINDLPDIIPHDCILFADDTTIVIKGRD
jgi:hypothetical protein